MNTEIFSAGKSNHCIPRLPGQRNSIKSNLKQRTRKDIQVRLEDLVLTLTKGARWCRLIPKHPAHSGRVVTAAHRCPGGEGASRTLQPPSNCPTSPQARPAGEPPRLWREVMQRQAANVSHAPGLFLIGGAISSRFDEIFCLFMTCLMKRALSAHRGEKNKPTNQPTNKQETLKHLVFSF